MCSARRARFRGNAFCEARAFWDVAVQGCRGWGSGFRGRWWFRGGVWVARVGVLGLHEGCKQSWLQCLQRNFLRRFVISHSFEQEQLREDACQSRSASVMAEGEKAASPRGEEHPPTSSSPSDETKSASTSSVRNALYRNAGRVLDLATRTNIGLRPALYKLLPAQADEDARKRLPRRVAQAR